MIQLTHAKKNQRTHADAQFVGKVRAIKGVVPSRQKAGSSGAEHRQMGAKRRENFTLAVCQIRVPFAIQFAKKYR